MADKYDELRKAFEALKQPGKRTVDVAAVYEETCDSAKLRDKFPLAAQFLHSFSKDGAKQAGIDFEQLREDVEQFFTSERVDEEDEEEALEGYMDFDELREKLDLFDSREKLERMWDSLGLDEYFTEKCKEYIVDGIVNSKKQFKRSG